jgi:hypothetical protein
VKRLVLVAVGIAIGGCKKSGEPDKLPVPEPPVAATDDAATAAAIDPEAAEAERLMQEMTRGAVDGSRLMGFAPATLAGVTRSHRHEQVFAVAAAYELDGGGYANLDIKNSFRRGGIDLEDQLMRACKRSEQVAGHVACVIVKPDRASAHWDLPDRLTVDLSAPDEKLLRQMAAELPLADIAALSKAPSDP